MSDPDSSAAETAEPRDAQIPYARATIHAPLGQMDAAKKAASRALEVEPAIRGSGGVASAIEATVVCFQPGTVTAEF